MSDTEMDSEAVGGAGEYFASLADLMTGVMFIFVILMTFYAISARQEKATASASVARAEAAARESHDERAKAERKHRELEEKDAQLNAKSAELDDKRIELDAAKRVNDLKTEQINALAQVLHEREQRRREMLRDMERTLIERKVMVSLDLDNGIIRLPESMLFDQGKAELRPEGREKLGILGTTVAASLRKWSPAGGGFQMESFFIEGHTDNVPINNGEFRNNWELSTARAVNTSEAITSMAPELRSFRNPAGEPILGVSGYGELRPVAKNDSDAARQLNRRIDLRFIVAYPTAEEFRRVQRLLEDKK